jgi:uncharacterized protein YjbI with pentapeptide repeats
MGHQSIGNGPVSIKLLDIGLFKKIAFIVLGMLTCILIICASKSRAVTKPQRALAPIKNEILAIRSRTGYIAYINLPRVVTPLYPNLDCHKDRVTLSNDKIEADYLTVRQSVDKYIKDQKISLPLNQKQVGIVANLCNSIVISIRQNTLPEIGNLNLDGSDFSNASLKDVVFWQDDLSDSNFEGALLEHSAFLNIDGNLRKWSSENHLLGTTILDFYGAKLMGASIKWSNLRGASFQNANLSGANIVDNDLSDADFSGATLNGVMLQNSDLTSADFSNADVSGLVYEPKLGGIPNLAALSTAKNLEKMTYKNNPAGLIQLREEFRHAGFRNSEELINYAINNARVTKELTSKNFTDRLQGLFEYVLFQLPTAWGAHPFRAFTLILLGIAICCPFYFLFIFRNYYDESNYFSCINRSSTDQTKISSTRLATNSIFNAALWGLYLSVLAAFNIGWQGLNLRAWIIKLQPKYFEVEGKGWPRVVTGVQALFSVYMLVMFVLSYFGRSFTAQ